MKSTRIFYLFFVYLPLFGFAQDASFHHPHLWEDYAGMKLSPANPEDLNHEALMERLAWFSEEWPEDFNLEKTGESVEGRDIFLVRMGSGDTKVLLWSQMHGDEPTATSALVDIFHYLLQEKNSEFVKDILEGSTLYFLPMLNPDGAERDIRRNAMGIDVNRDARDLQTPEGRILKEMRDRYEPEFGFNLHDQSSRMTVGKTNNLATVALMAPPYDWEGNTNAVRLRAKKVASVILQSLSARIYGCVAKYDDDFMPRAFGDGMQAWGTSTVLIETGGWYDDDEGFMVHLNYVAILSALHAIATGNYEKANAGLYDALPENDKDMYDLLLTGASVYDGVNPFAFKADIGINFDDDEKYPVGMIADMGDLKGFAGKDSIVAEGWLVMPGFIRYSDPSEMTGHGMPSDERVTTSLMGMRASQILMHTGEPSEDEVFFSTNLGWLIRPDGMGIPDHYLDDWAAVLSRGAVGFDAVELDEKTRAEVERVSSWFDAVVVDEETRVNLSDRKYSWEELKSLTSGAAKKYQISSRGLIRRRMAADLLLFDTESYKMKKDGIVLKSPTEVLINGIRIGEGNAGRLIVRQSKS